MVKAIQNLYEARDLQLPLVGGHHLTTASGKMDRIDLSVRLLLSHLRLLNVNAQLKNKICRMLTQTEVLRLGHTLDKMDLLLGYVQEAPFQEQTPPPLAIMDIEEPTPASLPSMPSFPMKKSTTSSLSMPSWGKGDNTKKDEDHQDGSQGQSLASSHQEKGNEGQNKACEKGPEDHSNSQGKSLIAPPSLLVVPPDTNIHLFHSPQYGSCKMEIFSQKSYIRKKDEGKWKSIIGSCSSKHGEVVGALVPYVIQGLNVEELYKVRNSLDL